MTCDRQQPDRRHEEGLLPALIDEDADLTRRLIRADPGLLSPLDLQLQQRLWAVVLDPLDWTPR